MVDPVNENHAVMLDPSGTIVWDYQKVYPTPGDGQHPVPGDLPSVDTPYGRLATIICQDDFFPGFVRQAGAAGVDILLVPSSDWDSAADWHAQQMPFRAVENGMAVVRPTRQGISLATDGQGRLLGHKPDYYVGDDQTLVVPVPTQGTTPGTSVSVRRSPTPARPDCWSSSAPRSYRSDVDRTGEGIRGRLLRSDRGPCPARPLPHARTLPACDTGFWCSP